MSNVQLQASDPNVSSWVSASAGTGKTKVLIDRILRLLLKKVEFKKILCLTFTNAAANEIQERITTKLEEWSSCSRESLVFSLKNILGKNPSRVELTTASSLLESYFKTQDQINICTIHSFCQKILKKFPLEANVSPHFKVIDELKVIKITKDIKNQIFNLHEMKYITNFFLENFHESTIDNILCQVISARTKILTNWQDFLSYKDYLKSNEKEYISNLVKHNPYISIKEISNSEIKNLIIKSLGKYNASIDIRPFFLTLSGKKKERLIEKKTSTINPDLYMEVKKKQEDIYQLDQTKKTENLSLNSKLIKILAEKLLLEFELYKSKNAFLDYDDLILLTHNLLTNSNAKEWVLYKLDGGIEHLLVDEAQDTSNLQWNIIESIVQEFYSGDSRNKKTRTIFIVGDEKQSIFSFQGADVLTFSYMKKFFKNKFKFGKKAFQIVDLNISYRSTKEILVCVTDVFNKIAKNTPEAFQAKLTKIRAYRRHNGLVQLWPLCLNDSMSTQFWPLYKKDNRTNAKVTLAQRIANYINKQINSRKTLPSTNKEISYQDFMILFRTRDNFTEEVIKALKNANIDISGVDVLSLAYDLTVADLIAIANFVLAPEDNLNLAALIKSPIFKLSEREVYQLVFASKAKKLSLWKYINLTKHYFFIKKKLKKFLLLYHYLPLNRFFLYISDIINYRDNKNSEAIDEFLKLSQDYFIEYGNSLQNFIYWFRKRTINIKKNIESSKKLRITTVHSSKGLQAPIVILCDTTTLPIINNKFILDKNNQLLSPKSFSYVPFYFQQIKAKQYQKTYQEYLRLLYVAMTRAEDQLIICGYQNRRKIPENCWYNLIKRSLKEIGLEKEDGTIYYGDITLISS